jgi:flagellar basal-body rod protein FlgC
MNSIITTALSGMDAARQRLDVSAANVANVNADAAPTDPTADASKPQPYAPLRVSQLPLVSGGSFTTIQPVEPASVRVSALDSPSANAGGTIARPNVDLVTEGISQMTASRAYEANAQVMRDAIDLRRETLDAFGRPPRLDLNA